VALTLRRQLWACFPKGCPILTRISVVNDLKNVQEVHVRDASKPMHQALQMSVAAYKIAFELQQAGKKLLHSLWTTKGCGIFETTCIERGWIETEKGDSSRSNSHLLRELKLLRSRDSRNAGRGSLVSLVQAELFICHIKVVDAMPRLKHCPHTTSLQQCGRRSLALPRSELAITFQLPHNVRHHYPRNENPFA